MASLALAGLPLLVFWRNLTLYHVPGSGVVVDEPVSILIPARNEEAGIRDTLTAALATQGVTFEVVVLDDHSTDQTAAIVREFAERDPRVRLESAPELPTGWCGKQHACWVLAQRARFDLLLFLDADVRLSSDGVVRACGFLQDSGAALVSGVPRQVTGTWLERLLIPLIHFVLLGFLPLWQMRQSTLPAFGAGCGQFFLTRRAAYMQAGGHAAIRESLHDGVRLPRAYRMAGLMTDLFDATPLADCRMYRSAGAVWQGLSKNATEGLAAPRMIVPATLLLIVGQVVPFVLLAVWFRQPGTILELLLIGLAVACAWLPRWLAVRRFRQSWLGALLHPLGITIFLVLQWSALFRHLCGRPASWKQRHYAAVGES